ncbi:MAG: cation-transporting P-type ATPase [Alphaproteobacteria bacterium]|nr:cation-transporting P-type ATPase [Alphaproteobacteria bacterium]
MIPQGTSGLTAATAAQHLKRYGPNRLFTPAPVRFWHIAAEEITEPMILLLLVVGFFYSLWGELGDALTIVAIILILVCVEVGNEFRAKRAIAALERIAAPRARVRRDGKAIGVDTEAVVPGDVLVLTPGTRVAADGQLTTALSLALDEAALTGEAFPAEKAAGDSVFAGTVVMSGEGEVEVAATGIHTRIGQMSAGIQRVKPPKTPLQLAMKDLAGKLVWVALFFAILIPVIGLLRGGDFHQMVLTGLSLAFATIPEELPIIVTMVLALGSYVLSRQNFLVKRLRAAETLGDATVIVTDKTGTLTESRLKVVTVSPSEAEAQVIACALGTVSPEVPDALERAVIERARDLGILRTSGETLRLRHLGNGRRSKAAMRREADELRLYLVGAPEEVFERCADVRSEMRDNLAAEAAMGRRLIAAAQRSVDAADAERPFESLEQNLTLCGLISFADPPRPGVKETLARLAAAGLRTIIVTGDHPATAAAIAREVGVPAEQVRTGEEIDGLDDAALAKAVREVSVYARATPEHKYRLVQALQSDGEIVAVTGDGINDALALKAANVGIAMGIKGTDVAKEAAQAVLADDNYVTIGRGVFEGRKFFDNLRKGVSYYLSVKVGLIAIFLLPVVVGLPFPFSPVQIILLELFMDLAASAGFVVEPAEQDIYQWRSRPAQATLFGTAGVQYILARGILLFAAVMAAYAYAWWQGLSIAAIQTCAFAAWMAGHIVLAFISRSGSEWLLRHGIFANRVLNLWALAAVVFLIAAIYVPVLRDALHFQTLPPAQLAIIAALAALIVTLAEPLKIAIRPLELARD